MPPAPVVAGTIAGYLVSNQEAFTRRVRVDVASLADAGCDRSWDGRQRQGARR
jgi:hypothetical protein